MTAWSVGRNIWTATAGLTGVIDKLGALLIGGDPRPLGRHTARLNAVTRWVPGGVHQQAIAAIENALVDICAKALGVPVYELLGGPVCNRIPLHWSLCGTYHVGNRARFAAVSGCPPIQSLRSLNAWARK